MRRPINNGVPFQLNTGEGAIIFDATQFDPNYVYLVTLDAWVPTGEADTLALTVLTDGVVSQPRIFDSVPAAGSIDALRRGAIGPTRILERYACRGNQQIAALATLVENNPVTIWGFFERVGVSPMPTPMRPLQPTNNLASPYNAPVFSASVPPGSSQSLVLHQFDTAEERLDYLWLTLFASTLDGSDPGANSVLLKLAGKEIVIPVFGNLTPPSGFTNTFFRMPMIDFFEGLPLKSQGSDALSRIEVEIETPLAAPETVFYAEGRFFRS